MAFDSYGRKLDPQRKLRKPLGSKGVRQRVVVPNDPPTSKPNQTLLVQFPELGENDVIIPGTALLAFTITLTSTDVNRTIVQNLGRAIVKKMTIKISGNEILSTDHSDIIHCYSDLWKTANERSDAVYQGIDTSTGYIITRLRVGAGDADASTYPDEATVARVFGNRYCIPLDFELLESYAPFYQAGLGGTLQYELTFNDNSMVIRSTDPKASYKIEDISLEYEVFKNPDLAMNIRNQYAGRFAIYYDRIHCPERALESKSKRTWNIKLGDSARSMKGVLVIFVDPAKEGKEWGRLSEDFYNPKIKEVKVAIEGEANQLYSHGLPTYQMWDEARKYFAAGSKRQPEAAIAAKDLKLCQLRQTDYYNSKFALWLDLRSSDDDQLHGAGRRIKKTLNIEISREADGEGEVYLYIYTVLDATLQIENGNFLAAVF